VKNPPYFDGITMEPKPVGDITGARILAELGDSDHHRPHQPGRQRSARNLAGRRVSAGAPGRQKDFNSYGARRGNHEIMMRGTFANIRIRNEMLTNVEGGMTKHLPSGEQMPIYDAAMRYKAGRRAAGDLRRQGIRHRQSSRDWAAKGTMLLGVKAVIVESFERIHRSNLVGMGVLPLTFKEGMDRKTLGLTGDEIIDIVGPGRLKPRMDLTLVIHRPNGKTDQVPVTCRIDTVDEVAYYQHGGILQYVLRGMAKATCHPPGWTSKDILQG
jgi:aconitate hydratase